MTVSSDDPVVYVLHKECLQSAIFLPLDVFQVVRMDHTDNVVKFIGPTPAMMVPIKVFWFFQDSYVSVLGRDKLRSITSWYDTPPLF